MRKLTARQKEALSIIVSLLEKEGKGPTNADLGRALGVKNGFDYVNVLQRKGYLHRDLHTRHIEVVRQPEP